jgi:hypothetical protein
MLRFSKDGHQKESLSISAQLLMPLKDNDKIRKLVKGASGSIIGGISSMWLDANTTR